MEAKEHRRTRIFAGLLVFGAAILLFRTISMLTQDALRFLVWWVGGLLILEMLLDGASMAFSIRWIIRPTKKGPVLRFAAAATLLHAFRVLIFVLGRTGPWYDFDVVPAERAFHQERWTWGQVWFASVLSILGVMAVIWIWRRLARLRKAERAGQINPGRHV